MKENNGTQARLGMTLTDWLTLGLAATMVWLVFNFFFQMLITV